MRLCIKTKYQVQNSMASSTFVLKIFKWLIITQNFTYKETTILPSISKCF
jgi:hypothetical protein